MKPFFKELCRLVSSVSQCDLLVETFIELNEMKLFQEATFTSASRTRKVN